MRDRVTKIPNKKEVTHHDDFEDLQMETTNVRAGRSQVLTRSVLESSVVLGTSILRGQEAKETVSFIGNGPLFVRT